MTPARDRAPPRVEVPLSLSATGPGQHTLCLNGNGSIEDAGNACVHYLEQSGIRVPLPRAAFCPVNRTGRGD